MFSWSKCYTLLGKSVLCSKNNVIYTPLTYTNDRSRSRIIRSMLTEEARARIPPSWHDMYERVWDEADYVVIDQSSSYY